MEDQVALFTFFAWAAVSVTLVACWPRIAASRPWEAAALLATLALSLTHQVLFNTLAEDAYITFRYSVNLAEGNGPVFNVGERVEGYSNFLWMALLALPRSFADVDIVLVARVLGVACTLGSLVVLHLLVRRVTGSAPAGVLAVLLAAGAGSLAAYGPSGLETPLFTLLVLATVLATVGQRPIVAGVLAALATMTRPDGIVVAAAVGLWLIVRYRNVERGWRFPVLFAAAALVLAVPWTAWRVQYYGHLLPNALAAKSGLDLGWQLESGWVYFLGFLGVAQALLVLVPLATYALASRRVILDRERRGAGRLLLATAVPYLAFFVATGGDWMPAWRFFAPAIPLLAAVIAVSWGVAGRLPSLLAASGRGAVVIGATVTALMLAASVTNPMMVPRVATWRQQVLDLAELGSWLQRTLPPGTVVSTFANGSLSFHAGPQITVVDQLGLTDEHIAREGARNPTGRAGHAAFDYNYVVNVRQPAVVFTTSTGFPRVATCTVPPQIGPQYVGRVYELNGRRVPVYLRAERADELTSLLAADAGFQLVPCPEPVPAQLTLPP